MYFQNKRIHMNITVQLVQRVSYVTDYIVKFCKVIILYFM